MNDPSNPDDQKHKPVAFGILGQRLTVILVVSAVLIAAHMGFKYQSWQVFLLFLVPLIIIAGSFARIFRVKKSPVEPR